MFNNQRSLISARVKEVAESHALDVDDIRDKQYLSPQSPMFLTQVIFRLSVTFLSHINQNNCYNYFIRFSITIATRNWDVHNLKPKLHHKTIRQCKFFGLKMDICFQMPIEFNVVRILD